MSEVKFLSLDELEKLGGFSLLQSYRRSGKPLLETDALMKRLEAWESKEIVNNDNPFAKGLEISGSFQFTIPNKAFKRFLLLMQFGKAPGLNTLEVGNNYRTIIEGEWQPAHKTESKKTYKPHSFQPAKGEAPRSCKPNPKTVAKNRAKRKLKKK